MKRFVYISNVKLDSTSGQNSFSMHLAKEFVNYYQAPLIVCPYKPHDSFLSSSGTGSLKWLFKSDDLRFLKLILYQLWLIWFFIKTNNKSYFAFSIKPYMFSAIILPMVGAKFSVFVEGLIPRTTSRLWPSWASKASTKMIEAVMKKADVVTAAYESACQWIHDFGRTDVKLIPCGVSPAKGLAEVTQQADYDICYIGSFRDVHMLDLLVAFANEYRLSICLVGDGRQMQHVKGLARASKGGHFVFTGHVAPDDVFRYVNRSRVGWGMCEPSHHGVPMKVAEYASVGVSSIVSSYENFHWLHSIGACYSPNSFKLSDVYQAFNNCVLKSRQFPTEAVIDRYGWRNYPRALETFVEC